MNLRAFRKTLILGGLTTTSLLLVGRAVDQQSIKGQVLGGGAPIADSKVTLYAATPGEPKQLAQAKTDKQGQFEVRVVGAPVDSSLYLVAVGGEPKGGGGDNPAIALMTILGSKPPSTVTINEMTTVAGRTLNSWTTRPSKVTPSA